MPQLSLLCTHGGSTGSTTGALAGFGRPADAHLRLIHSESVIPAARALPSQALYSSALSRNLIVLPRFIRFGSLCGHTGPHLYPRSPLPFSEVALVHA